MLNGPPALLAPNVACLDYSVAAKKGGKLVAHRWDGEQRLSGDNLGQTFSQVVRIGAAPKISGYFKTYSIMRHI